MKKYAKTIATFLLAVVLMSFMAGAGAWAAGGLRIGGRALVDIVPVDTIKTVTSTALRHQTVDLVSKYLVQVADQAIHLEISTYDHLSVLYNMVVSMPDTVELISLESRNSHLFITGLAESRTAAETFAERLDNRGFVVAVADYADNMAGESVFYFELSVPQSQLSMP